MTTSLQNRISLIERAPLRFLILDAPTDANLPQYIAELKKHNTKMLVRVCEASYTTERVERAGIKVYHWPFSDGQAPPAHIVNDWLDLVESAFGGSNKSDKKDKKKSRGEENNNDTENDASNGNEDKGCIAVHCVAGLGRAPVLVAIALIESGMEPLDAIAYIRERRRGAINATQIQYIEKYKPRNKKGKCVVM